MPSAIEARGLTKAYGGSWALRDFSIEVAEGEVFGLLGPNGAGKTTTTRILTTLIRATGGSARVAGFDVVGERAEVRRRIGYLPERMPVYRAMTAREFLRFFARVHHLPRTVREKRIDELLDLLNLHDVDGKRVGTFSKGMTQRLGLARALLNAPRVLFLDEPASGLDPTGRKEIRLIIRSIAAQGTAVLLCTHDLAEASAVCDRIGLLRAGVLVKVQSVGPNRAESEERELTLEIHPLRDEVPALLESLEGVRGVKMENERLRVRFAPPATRLTIAQTLANAGILVVSGAERPVDIEALYEEFVEKPRELRPQSPPGIPEMRR
ncbi:MAG: ABC transporter ATP-binding protein [Thermoplasmatota archaeon]